VREVTGRSRLEERVQVGTPQLAAPYNDGYIGDRKEA